MITFSQILTMLRAYIKVETVKREESPHPLPPAVGSSASEHKEPVLLFCFETKLDGGID